MADLLKKVFMTGLGALSVTAEKASEIIDELVKRGGITLEQGKEMAKEYKEKFDTQIQEFDKKAESTISGIISNMNIATKEDLKIINERLDRLEQQIHNR